MKNKTGEFLFFALVMAAVFGFLFIGANKGKISLSESGAASSGQSAGLLDIFFKKPLPDIEKAWIDESDELISKRDLNIVIKFKRQFPALPPTNDEFVGLLIDLDRSSRTGALLKKGPYSDQPPYQYNDLGVDLFTGLKSKNGKWIATSEVERFAINNDTVVVTVPLQNLASEFLWKAVAGSSKTYTGTVDRHFIIKEALFLNLSE